MSVTDNRNIVVLALSVALAAQPAVSQERQKPAPIEAASDRGLPAEVVTRHRVTIERPFDFLARAGAVRLNDGQSNAPLADLSYVSFELEGVEPARRPIVFAINGGPGAGAAWLGLGAMGPWRIRMDPRALAPSAAPQLIDNAESWLPFADIVLVDPPGSGYSRLLSPNEEVRKQLYSMTGDVDAIAVFIRKWLTLHNRLSSPKFVVGESYGGLRAPKVAYRLSQRENIGVKGMILVSPALDISKVEGDGELAAAAHLPTYAALHRKARDRATLKDAEDYAAGEYIVDLLKGPRDAAVQLRLTEHVAALTGLDAAFVRRAGARIDVSAFARETDRASGRIASVYDGAVSGPDPDPADAHEDWNDPVLDAIRAPLGEAMTQLVTQVLKWPIGEARYETLNETVARQWDWGPGGRRAAESMRALRRDLALDPDLKVTVVHGLADLVTPYFATKLTLDQLPASLFDGRVSFVSAPAGHMVYSSDEGRAQLRDAARAMISP